MSLLLDALKKAAQKKAEKSTESSESVDTTDNVDRTSASGFSPQDDTALTETVLSSNDSGVVEDHAQLDSRKDADETELEQTQLDATHIDKTVIDKTELGEESHDTVLTETELLHTDPTQLEEKKESEVISAENTSIDSEDSVLGSAPSEGESDVIPPLEETVEIEAQFVQLSEFNEVDDSDDMIASDNDPTELGEDVKFVDSTEMDFTSLDNTEIRDDTVLDVQSRLSDDERTLFIIDGAESSASVDTENVEEFEKLQEIDAADIQAKYNRHLEKAEDNLTEDDVTQFMGDGVHQERTGDAESHDTSRINIDDTTLTNPESLTLTNFSFDDIESEKSISENNVSSADSTKTDTYSLHEFDGKLNPDQTFTLDSPYQNDISEDDKSTRINTDQTSTVSSINIENLTSDGSIVQDHKTSSRAYAPDNYDRTLLNLSEKDVSNIFPGLRPDSDTVMTPDYAKRIFLSKSDQLQTRYFKLYASIAIILLLTVVILGLFQLQEESVFMDNGLISLKRDPMPGIIKPQVVEVSDRLFVPEPETAEIRTIDILSKADEPVSEQTDLVSSENESRIEQQEVIEKTNEQASLSSDIQGESTPKIISPATKTKSTPIKTSSTSSLSISSVSQVSQQDQLLNEAYAAYEQGDSVEARSLYNKVLLLDASNRDALLGTAAIYVRENEYPQAIANYQRLLVANPKDSIAMASLISVANIDPQSAETQLKSLLRDQPESPYIHFVLGNMYGSQHRWKEAQSEYFSALQENPDDPNYAYNLAVSMEHLGKSATAVDFYKKALGNSAKGLVTFNEQVVVQRIEVLTQ